MAPRTPVDRDAVLRAALSIIDEEGLDALTMRRLGERLDRNAMVLYRHAAGRAELLDGVLEVVLADLVIPVGEGTWQDQLRITARRLRRIALEHPNVVPLLAARPLATPLGLRSRGTLRPFEQMLDVLRHAGFAPADGLRVYRAFYGLLLGHVLVELEQLVADGDEADAILRLGLQRLPPKEFPRIHGVAEEMLRYDHAAELDRSVEVLLNGLGEQLVLGPRVALRGDRLHLRPADRWDEAR